MTDLWLDQHQRDHEDNAIDPDTIAIAREMLDAEIEDKLFVGDALDIIWLVQSKNEVQPIIFPMRLHVHDQDCGRA